MIRKVAIQEIIEQYIECPYCHKVIRDTFGDFSIEELIPGTKIKCPGCNKTIKLEAI